MKPWLTIAAVLGGAGFAATTLLVVHTAWAGGWCCQTSPSYGPCIGCVSTAVGYVHAGSNTVELCQSTERWQSCSGSPELCFSLVDTAVYSSSQGQTEIGTATVSRTVAQCDFADDACSSGG